ncbi:MAG: hypothetical protein WC761_04625 [Candidatus Paceibacterota bacterium]|jgi:uncharacterized membrane protein YkgB
MTYRSIDLRAIHFMRKISVPVARFAIFLVFFWFGILKVFFISPASPLVLALLDVTMPFIPADVFLACFGALECIIGILFLIPGAERLAILTLFLHLITTTMPLFLLPHLVWTGSFIPTLEGQYIVKNILLIATAIGIASHLHPLPRGHYLS